VAVVATTAVGKRRRETEGDGDNVSVDGKEGLRRRHQGRVVNGGRRKMKAMVEAEAMEEPVEGVMGEVEVDALEVMDMEEPPKREAGRVTPYLSLRGDGLTLLLLARRRCFWRKNRHGGGFDEGGGSQDDQQ
jgi:hypothetical protein